MCPTSQSHCNLNVIKIFKISACCWPSFFFILNVIFIALCHAPSEQCLCFQESELRLHDLHVLASPFHNIHPAYLVENSKAFMLWIVPSTMSASTNPTRSLLSTNSMFSTSLQPLGSWLGHAIWTSCFCSVASPWVQNCSTNQLVEES